MQRAHVCRTGGPRLHIGSPLPPTVCGNWGVGEAQADASVPGGTQMEPPQAPLAPSTEHLTAIRRLSCHLKRPTFFLNHPQDLETKSPKLPKTILETNTPKLSEIDLDTVPIVQKLEEDTDGLAEYTFPKFAATYFQKSASHTHIRRLLRYPLLYHDDDTDYGVPSCH